MRKRAAGRCRQDLTDQPFCACNIGRSRVGQLTDHASRERARQPALRVDRSRVERQRMLEQADGLGIVVACWALVPRSPSPENVVQRIWMLGRPGGLCSDQLEVEGVSNPGCDLVLQGEQIARVAVEPLRPEM